MNGGTMIYPEPPGSDARIPGVYTMEQLDSAYKQMHEPAKRKDGTEDPTDSEDFEARVKRMQLAERGYNGNLPNPFLPKAGEQDLNLKANRLRAIVNTSAALLFGASVQFAIRDAQEKDPTGDIGAALASVWDANKQAKLLNRLGITGAKFGHVFVKLVDQGIMHDGETLPRMVLLDPRQMDVELDPDDCEMVRAYNYYWLGAIISPDGKPRAALRRQRWQRTDDNTNAQGEPAPLGSPEQWTTYNQYSTDNNLQFTTGGYTVREWVDLTDPVEWPYPWCPIHEAQNLPNTSRHFGTEDITPDLIRLQEEINFCKSNIKAIQYYLGHPLLWGRGFTESQFRRSPDNVLIIESETGELNAIPMNGDISQHRDHEADLRQDMEEISGFPAWMLGRLEQFPRGDVPGITLRTSAQGAINKTTMKRELYGDMLNTLNSHLLEMMEHGKGIACDVIWQDVLPANEKEWSETTPVALQVGMSKKTALAKLGVDYDQERQQRMLEAQDDAEDAAKLLPPGAADDTMGGMMDDGTMGATGNMGGMMADGTQDPNANQPGTDSEPLTNSARDGRLSASGVTSRTNAGLASPAMKQARKNAIAAAASTKVAARAPSSAQGKAQAGKATRKPPKGR